MKNIRRAPRAAKPKTVSAIAVVQTTIPTEFVKTKTAAARILQKFATGAPDLAKQCRQVGNTNVDGGKWDD